MDAWTLQEAHPPPIDQPQQPQQQQPQPSASFLPAWMQQQHEQWQAAAREQAQKEAMRQQELLRQQQQQQQAAAHPPLVQLKPQHHPRPSYLPQWQQEQHEQWQARAQLQPSAAWPHSDTQAPPPSPPASEFVAGPFATPLKRLHPSEESADMDPSASPSSSAPHHRRLASPATALLVSKLTHSLTTRPSIPTLLHRNILRGDPSDPAVVERHVARLTHALAGEQALRAQVRAQMQAESLAAADESSLPIISESSTPPSSQHSSPHRTVAAGSTASSPATASLPVGASPANAAAAASDGALSPGQQQQQQRVHEIRAAFLEQLLTRFQSQLQDRHASVHVGSSDTDDAELELQELLRQVRQQFQ